MAECDCPSCKMANWCEEICKSLSLEDSKKLFNLFNGFETASLDAEYWKMEYDNLKKQVELGFTEDEEYQGH